MMIAGIKLKLKENTKLNRDNAQGYFNKIGPQLGLGPYLELSNSRIQLFAFVIKMNSLTGSQSFHCQDSNTTS